MMLAMLLSLMACSAPTADDEPAEGNTATEDAADGDTEEASEDQNTADSSEKIVIGVTGNLTGYDPSSGEAVQNTADLAMELINAEGGILGKELEIRVFDDQGSAEGAVNAVSLMLEDEEICMIGGLVYSTCALAVDEIVENGGKPTIVSGSTPSISDLNNPWMFRLRTDDNVQASCALEYLCEVANPSVIGGLYTTDDYSYGCNVAAENWCKEKGIEFVSAGGAIGDVDFTSQILTLKDAGCEAVYISLNAAEMVIACRQMHELGYDPAVMTGMTASNSAFIDLVEGEEVGGWYTYSEISFDSDVEGCQEFLSEYKSRYGKGNPESSAIIVYGQIQLMMDAITRAGTTEAEALKTALEETKDVQVITGLLTCDEKHDLPGCTFVKEITEDKVEEICALYVGYERQY